MINIIYVIMKEGRRGDEPADLPDGVKNEFTAETSAENMALELAAQIEDLMGPAPRYWIKKLYTK